MVAQQYVLENEKVLFEFTTTNNKKLVIAKNISDLYLVYRYGSSTEIELEFPINKEGAWENFKFSSYSRGGGEMNEGIELNYIYFDIGIYTYVVYEEYLAKKGKTNYGIKIVDAEKNKIEHIKVASNSVRGSLTIFREQKKIKKGDELFM